MRKTLIISFFSLLPIIGAAQYQSAFAHVQDTLGDAVLVRSWSNIGTISVHRKNNSDVFSYTDFAGKCATTGGPFSLLYLDSVKLLHVKDMFIVDNHVFFCGVMGGTNAHGVIGHFDVNEFFSTYGTLNLMIREYSTDISFKKLVAYPDNTSYTVVALGSIAFGAPYLEYDFLLEEPNFLSMSLFSSNINYFSVPNTGPNNENYHDMLLLNEYIVLVGCYNSQQPCSRVTERNNVLGSSLLSNCRLFSSSTTEVTGNVVATTLSIDSIAIAYVHPEPNINQFSTRIRTIHIPTMNNTHSQEFSLNGKINPFDMIYSSKARKIILLMPEVNTTYPFSEFIKLNPHPASSYNTQSTYKKEKEFKTIDLFWEKNFISTYTNTLYYQNINATLPTPSGECPQTHSINVTTIPNNTHIYTNGAIPLTISTLPGIISLNVHTGNLIIDCGTQYKTGRN